MDEKTKKRNAFQWQKEQTTQYNLRFMNATGIPQALKKATNATGETTTEYMKTSVVQRLRAEGFLAEGAEVVLNLNKQRHKQKLKRLEAYLEQEKKKMK